MHLMDTNDSVRDIGKANNDKSPPGRNDSADVEIVPATGKV